MSNPAKLPVVLFYVFRMSFSFIHFSNFFIYVLVAAVRVIKCFVIIRSCELL